MKSYLLSVFLVVGLVSSALAQTTDWTVYNKTIPQIQTVSIDSLLKLDTLQNASSGLKLDDSPLWHGADAAADTVRVTGVVIVKPRILTYTLNRWNIFIQDTTTGQLWGGLNVLVEDTTANQTVSDNITALDSGDVVTITGRVTEFGSSGQNNGLTEIFYYKVGFFQSVVSIDYLGTRSRPDPVEVPVDSFAVGTTPKPSRGEKYEGMYVVVRNVTVNSVNVANGDFTFVDSSGNQMRMYDGSGWYTLRSHKITGSKYSPPPVGTQLAYIRGVVLPQARSGTSGEYTIMPLYPGPGQKTGSTYAGDIVISKFAPSITEVTRKPTVPKSTDAVGVTFRAKDLNTSGDVDSAFINYRNAVSGPFVRTLVTLAPGDSLYRATIPAQANNSYVSYFASAYSGGGFGMYPDSTIPYFYVIRDGGLSVYDLQYTPYSNGISAFVGDTVQVGGTIVSDTSDIKLSASGRPILYLAGGAGAWNGIALLGTSAAKGIDTLARGDSLVVTGVVVENFSRTELRVTNRDQLFKGAGTVPAPTVVGISGAGSLSYQLSNGPTDGNPTFEKWESVLIQIVNPYLVYRNADNLANTASSNFGEYFIGSSKTTTFGLRVDDAGTNRFYADTSSNYTAKPADAVLVNPGQKFSFINGILDWSFSFYKLEPRKDSDFGTITGVERVDEVPASYVLDQNYPNPFNPTTTIRFSVPTASRVTLKVYNVLGQEVASIVDGEFAAGTYLAPFNASRLATGVYFYQLRAGDFVTNKKMVLLK